MGCGCAGSTRRPAASGQTAATPQNNGPIIGKNYVWNGPQRPPAAAPTPAAK